MIRPQFGVQLYLCLSYEDISDLDKEGEYASNSSGQFQTFLCLTEEIRGLKSHSLDVHLLDLEFSLNQSGPRSQATVSFIPTVHNINEDTSTQALDDVVREFWSLESIGIQPIQEKKKSTSNSELLTNFYHSFEIIDGR
ncbi:hypothetical protein NPIL_656541 [Nephila pilipes]|uniref:Uncharacterized protein n=1 Tax=Nephila pilipes TaxID=299642 RepID=A0A8X6NQY0_NEPPI|nr:hypothetical protein NPIL_656541 [Nephila pilipes]